MTKDLVSIMIPTYNRPVLFEETLLSALHQDYERVEIIVCDNSTDDATEKIIEKYGGDPRLIYIRTGAKNKADNFAPFERLANGEYLQWLMDDDILAKNKLRLMMKCFADNPSVSLVTSQRGIIDGEGNFVGRWPVPFPVKSEYSIYPPEFIIWMTLRHAMNFIGEPSAVLFRRRDLTHHYWRAEVRGYAAISDVVMWMELMEKGSLAIFQEPLSFYRRHAAQEGQQVDVALLSRIEWNALNEEYLQKQIYPYAEEDYLAFSERRVEEYDTNYHKLKEYAGEDIWHRYEEFIAKARRTTAAFAGN